MVYQCAIGQRTKTRTTTTLLVPYGMPRLKSCLSIKIYSSETNPASTRQWIEQSKSRAHLRYFHPRKSDPFWRGRHRNRAHCSRPQNFMWCEALGWKSVVLENLRRRSVLVVGVYRYCSLRFTTLYDFRINIFCVLA